MLSTKLKLGLTLVAAAVLVAPARGQDELTGPLKRLQGTWNFAFPDGGKGTWEVKGENVTVSMPDGSRYESAVTFDNTVSPIAVDFKITGGEPDAVGQMVKGIFRMMAGKANVCVSAPGMDRPDKFEGDEDSDIYFFELTREGGADEPQPAARALRRVQGSWKSALPDGKEVHYEFKSDTLVVEAPNRRYEATVTLDPEAKPHAAVDFHIVEGPEDAKGQTNQGIYRMEKGKLTLCIDGGAGERPLDFVTEEGKSYVFELTKVEEDKE